MKHCSISECSKKYYGHGYCQMHYRRWYRHGSTDPQPRAPSGRGRDWGGDAVTYWAVHVRLRTQRGEASTFLCRCGAPARDWAYDHQDPDEKGDPFPYSTDLTHYEPLCKPCHWKQDSSR